MAHMLGRADPWASRRSCDDKDCCTCEGKRWLQEQKKACRRDNTKLPDVLIQKTANQCRREGVNYSLQCLDCALEGVAATYWGESGLSARQRHQQHRDLVEKGDVTSPMVLHSVEMHGGRKPRYLSLIHTIESRPLYRAVRESVQISSMPMGPTRLNRCQEWGAPRVPVLTATGGDDPTSPCRTANPRPLWTQQILEQIENGSCKRVKYWTEHTEDQDPSEGSQDPPRPSKRRRQGPNPQDLDNTGEQRPGDDGMKVEVIDVTTMNDDMTSSREMPGQDQLTVQTSKESDHLSMTLADKSNTDSAVSVSVVEKPQEPSVKHARPPLEPRFTDIRTRKKEMDTIKDPTTMEPGLESALTLGEEPSEPPVETVRPPMEPRFTDVRARRKDPTTDPPTMDPATAKGPECHQRGTRGQGRGRGQPRQPWTRTLRPPTSTCSPRRGGPGSRGPRSPGLLVMTRGQRTTQVDSLRKWMACRKDPPTTVQPMMPATNDSDSGDSRGTCMTSARQQSCDAEVAPDSRKGSADSRKGWMTTGPGRQEEGAESEGEGAADVCGGDLKIESTPVDGFEGELNQRLTVQKGSQGRPGSEDIV